jgi:PIN domain nuclease of toxin-antitoxin system
LSGYLLDTNVVLIALGAPDRLPATVQRAVLRGPNVVSVVSYWEVVLKSMKGTLSVGDLRSWWHEALEQLAANPLMLQPDHIAGICSLPDIHKDPFDRALIAQAAVEGLSLVSLDAVMPRYASTRLRVVS